MRAIKQSKDHHCQRLTSLGASEYQSSGSGGQFPYAASVKVREVVRLLEREGWRLVATQGSH